MKQELLKQMDSGLLTELLENHYQISVMLDGILHFLLNWSDGHEELESLRDLGNRMAFCEKLAIEFTIKHKNIEWGIDVNADGEVMDWLEYIEKAVNEKLLILPSYLNIQEN